METIFAEIFATGCAIACAPTAAVEVASRDTTLQPVAFNATMPEGQRKVTAPLIVVVVAPLATFVFVVNVPPPDACSQRPTPLFKVQ